jgi:hypothetical protein
MDEIATLKAEISRLNNIITILIDQINIMKGRYSASNFANEDKNDIATIPDFENGDNKVIATIPNFNNSSNNIFPTISDFKKDNDKLIDTIPDFKNSSNNINTTIVNIENGSNTNLEGAPKIVPAYIELNNYNISYVAHSLRGIFGVTVKWGKLKAVASELLYLHNNGHGSYEDLRKITMLSNPGFDKHAPTLKRKGLIMRQSHKKYVLTEMSKGIINKVFTEKDVYHEK